MNKSLVVLLFFVAFHLSVNGQVSDNRENSKYKASEESRFYAGFQVGIPLFWGDLFSLGKEKYLGYAGGVFVGLRATPWLGAEMTFDYGQGKMGAKKWQQEDYLGSDGVIHYITGNWKLGDVYNRTTFIRTGVRVPVRLLQLLRPNANNRFDIELAPHAHVNNYSPGIYAISDDKKLADGNKPADWTYSVGGDIGINYRIKPRTSVFLRSSLSWLSDERFDGVSSKPEWRVNLLSYTSIGISFSLGKKKQILPATIIETVVKPTPKPTSRVEKTNLQAKELTADEKYQLAIQQEAERRKVLIAQMQLESIPVIYFKRNSIKIDTIKYKEELQSLTALTKKYDFAPIVIEGWCDTYGSEKVNRVLSEKRAQALADLLIKEGIAADCIITKGMGVDVANGTTAEARRVVLKFTLEDK